jgi:hypothetical protein
MELVQKKEEEGIRIKEVRGGGVTLLGVRGGAEFTCIFQIKLAIAISEE